MGQAENQDLSGYALEQPLQIVVAQPRMPVFLGGDDDAVEVLLIMQVDSATRATATIAPSREGPAPRLRLERAP